MKLFIWEPQGHGQDIVVVVEENLEKAQAAANQFVEDTIARTGVGYHYNGWGTEHYQLTTMDPGKVMTFENS